MKVEDVLLGQITLCWQKDDGEIEEAGDFDLSLLTEMTFVETLDISGPRFVVTFDDFSCFIRDCLNARPRDLLKVSFSSHWREAEGEGDDLELVMWFRIMTMPQQGSLLTFNCIEKEVESIKQPSPKTMLFTDRQVPEILGKLLPNLKQRVGRFPTAMDYHVLPGMRASKTIRQMCHELQAACFNQRGTLVFETWSNLFRQEPELEYSHQTSRGQESDEEIYSYQMLRSAEIIKERVERNYMSFDIKNGIVQTTNGRQKPSEWVSPSLISTLDNLSVVPSPAIDLLTTGQGNLQAGVVMAIRWHSGSRTQPLDESLPRKILVSTVAHYYSGSNYLCRAKGMILG